MGVNKTLDVPVSIYGIVYKKLMMQTMSIFNIFNKENARRWNVQCLEQICESLRQGCSSFWNSRCPSLVLLHSYVISETLKIRQGCPSFWNSRCPSLVLPHSYVISETGDKTMMPQFLEQQMSQSCFTPLLCNL